MKLSCRKQHTLKRVGKVTNLCPRRNWPIILEPNPNAAVPNVVPMNIINALDGMSRKCSPFNYLDVGVFQTAESGRHFLT